MEALKLGDTVDFVNSGAQVAMMPVTGWELGKNHGRSCLQDEFWSGPSSEASQKIAGMPWG